MRELTGAKIYASKFEAECAAKGTPPREPKTSNPLLKLLFSLTAKMFVYPPTLVDEIVKDGDVLPILGGLRVISTPDTHPITFRIFAVTQHPLAGDSLRTQRIRSTTKRHPSLGMKQNKTIRRWLQAELNRKSCA